MVDNFAILPLKVSVECKTKEVNSAKMMAVARDIYSWRVQKRVSRWLDVEHH